MKPAEKGIEADLDMAKRKDNEDELWAQDWLRQQGYRDIRRPCSDPPDFVVDGNYAVEVTRLNQRIVVGDEENSRGEEEARKPLTDRIAEAIGQLGPPGNEGCSWEIDCEYDFAEPLPTPKSVTRQVAEGLAPLLQPYDETVISAMHSRHFDYDKHAGEISLVSFPHLCLDCGICLELAEFSHEPARFILQNVSDGHGIGVAAELKASIRNRICDKSRRVRNRGRIGEYDRWWLVLVDHVCHAPIQVLSQHELSYIQDHQFDFWSRIVIVSSRNLHWWYELHSTETENRTSSHRR